MPTPIKKRKPKKSTQLKSIGKLKQARRHIFKVDEFGHLKMLIYGQPKRGKTTLAATSPKPMIVDCNDRGTLSIRKVKDVEVFRVDRWDDIQLALWYLRSTEHDRLTVVIDNLTSLSALCLRKVLGNEDLDEGMEPATPNKREWGAVAAFMRDIIIDFRNLDMHVIFIAQEKRGYDENDDEGSAEIFPSISPSVRDTLMAAVDCVGRLFIREVINKKGGKKRWQRRLLIGEDDTVLAGNRLGLGDTRIIRDPNIAKMLEEVRNN